MRLTPIQSIAAVAASLTVIVMLLALVLWQRNQSLPPITPIKPAASSLQVLAVTPPVQKIKEENHVRERPVFWASRKPFIPLLIKGKVKAKQKLKLKPGKEPFDKVKLLGIYDADGESGLIVSSETTPSQRLKVGDVFEGWMLEHMNAKGGVFAQGEKNTLLILQKPKPASKEIRERSFRQARKQAKSSKAKRQ